MNKLEAIQRAVNSANANAHEESEILRQAAMNLDSAGWHNVTKEEIKEVYLDFSSGTSEAGDIEPPRT